MLPVLSATVVILSAFQSALFLDDEVPLAPASWAIISVCIWLLFVLSKGGWSQLSRTDARRFVFGLSSAAWFLCFLHIDSEFKGWSSVYYFCGKKLQYCTCNFRWNYHGWLKAAVLWQFVLSATLGAQQLIIQAGLGELLPGEEAVTRESLISIGWRLIPFWLNNWEQQWGAEVSSMTFELPHFAVELLIILPCCQIICSRLKVLVTPQVNVLVGGAPGGVNDIPFVREDFAPNVLQGFWELRPEQRKFLPRVRSNLRVLVFLTGITALAALNATLLPLYLEGQAARADGTQAMVFIGRRTDWLGPTIGDLQKGVELNVTDTERLLLHEARERYMAYGESGCPLRDPYVRNVLKHTVELQRMQDPEHRSLIPLVESALAIMRLSCEKYFVLVAIYVAFLLFKDPPQPARVVVRVVARVSSIFQKVILFAFPVVCWLYNAGFIFSLFVSVVFWGGPLLALYDTVRSALRVVSIRSLTLASAEQVHRMGGSCAICWGEMSPHCSHQDHNQLEQQQQHTGQQSSITETDMTPMLPEREPEAEASASTAASTSAPELACGPSTQDGALQGHHFVVASESPSGKGQPPPQRQITGDMQQGQRTAEREGTEHRHGITAGVYCTTSPAHMKPQLGEAAAASNSGASGSAGDGGSLPLRVPSVSTAMDLNVAALRPDEGVATAPIAAAADSDVVAQPFGDIQGPQDAAGGAAGADGPTFAAAINFEAEAAATDARGPEAAWALPCGHAYHHDCLLQWMEQCSSNGVTPTCPMCQRGIQLQVRWRLPHFLRSAAGGAAAAVAADTEQPRGREGRAAAQAVVAGGVHLGAAGGGRFAAAGGIGGRDDAMAALAAAVPGLGAGANFFDMVHNLAGGEAGLQVVGLLGFQQELEELLQEAPALEFGEAVRDMRPIVVHQAAQPQPPQEPPALPPPPHQQEAAQQAVALLHPEPELRKSPEEHLQLASPDAGSELWARRDAGPSKLLDCAGGEERHVAERGMQPLQAPQEPSLGEPIISGFAGGAVLAAEPSLLGGNGNDCDGRQSTFSNSSVNAHHGSCSARVAPSVEDSSQARRAGSFSPCALRSLSPATGSIDPRVGETQLDGQQAGTSSLRQHVVQQDGSDVWVSSACGQADVEAEACGSAAELFNGALPEISSQVMSGREAPFTEDTQQQQQLTRATNDSGGDGGAQATANVGDAGVAPEARRHKPRRRFFFWRRRHQ